MEKMTQEVQTPQPEATYIVANPEECPTCISGTDPLVGTNLLFQEALRES